MARITFQKEFKGEWDGGGGETSFWILCPSPSEVSRSVGLQKKFEVDKGVFKCPGVITGIHTLSALHPPVFKVCIRSVKARPSGCHIT